MLSTRRDFIGLVLGAPLAASCKQARPSVPDGVLLDTGRARGHAALRSPVPAVARPSKLERVEVVVVGAGVAGLTAAWRLRHAGVRDVVVLEHADFVGGTAHGEADAKLPVPWGAHYIVAPRAEHRALAELLAEMGQLEGRKPNGDPLVSEAARCREPEERVFHLGRWYPGLYLHAGASTSDLAELARFEKEVAFWAAFRDAGGRRAFTLPASACSDDAAVSALDRISFQRFLDDRNLRSARLRWLCDYACRDDYGLGLAGTSAWAGLFYFASRIEVPGDPPAPVVTWPEGNQALVSGLARGLRVETGVTVTRVEESGSGVVISARDPRGARGFSAKRAVVATPSHVTRHIVPGAAAAGAAVETGAWAVANLYLRDRPRERPGAAPAWDNVLYDSKSLGYVSATHQRGHDYGATVLTWYYAFTELDAAKARRELELASRVDWADAALVDLERAHPDLRSLVERVDVAFWGHGMVRPVVGARFDPHRLDRIRPQGAIHFAHTDLSAIALFEEAFDHGLRAADEVLRALRSG